MKGRAGDRGPRRARTLSESWLQDKWPVVRFVLLFGLAISLFNVIAALPFSEQRVWPAYLAINAEISGRLLNLLGQQATVSERIISGPGCSLSIERGCDAVHPSILFIAAVLASPVAWWTKWPGIAIGTLALAVLNVVRIASLFAIRRDFPSLFEFMHLEFWQVLFIFLAVLFWALWALWARGASARRADAAT